MTAEPTFSYNRPRPLLKQFGRFFLLVAVLIGLAPTAQAQAAPPAYQFLTVITLESGAKVLSKVIFSPAFQGKSEVDLEAFSGFSTTKNLEKSQRNALLINQQLEALTASGWELVHVYPIPETGTITTRYLFRKAK